MAWLHLNLNNRRLKPGRVTKWAEEMRAGRWRVATPIQFARGEDGGDILIDGQHRLHAVVEANVPVLMAATFGHPMENQRIIDTNIVRSGSDVLGMAGEKDTNVLAATLRRLVAYDTGRSQEYATNRYLTNEEILILNERYPDTPRSIHHARSAHRVRVLTHSVGAFCHAIFHRDFPVAADAFFQAFATGVGLDGGHPILVLRNRMLADRERKVGMAAAEAAALTVKAFNAWVTGRKIRTLYWRTQGEDAEEFPTVVAGGSSVAPPLKIAQIG